mmetsp:Transcript_49853/g.97758  ORF Transcript_49853/g.97758 Transcript_49853/m.97758 type:complete len:352 (-) Transcript_49853:330-1385(-)|eukprot:CAMPEP_0175165020 /NCGR_PEP_ID=MMETSP0087-20121206/26797_1 /TAXON_ID=136419 /ORGANISM="Unknown Unknown, Strain D1" /LENGTH=351 /DNA_ID=CAMNT_0016454237 /DNA_START=99 /DNA_END=1154 /DNA_ORIENTATION=-
MSGEIKKEIEQCIAQIESYEQKIADLRQEKETYPLEDYANSNGISNNSDVGKMKLRKTLNGHFGKIYGMHWAPDSERLVSAAQDGKLIIWNGLSESMLAAVQLRSSWVMACAYSPDGKCVASGGLDNFCSVYQVDFSSASNTQGAKAELTQHEGYLSCCRFIGSNEMLTSSGDATCILWDIETSTAKTTFADHESDVMSVSAHESNQWFVSGSCDASAKLWDYRAGKRCLRTFMGHESDVNSVAFFPDGQAFGSASDDSTCRLFDIRSYDQLNCFKNEHIICGITSCDFSQSGKLLFAGYDDYNCYAWDVVTGNFVQTLNAHENRVSCLGVNKNGTALCTGSWSFKLKIWA